jgi:hypothetical protein
MNLLDVLAIAIFIFLLYELWTKWKSPSSDSYTRFDDPKLDELKQRLSLAFPEIRNLDLTGSNKSLTINKQHVFICTKDEQGEYYSDNMLIYVILHELAHVLCDEVGHTDKFRKIFQELLDRAHDAGVYDPSIPPIDNYCNY